jgi:hypothetical protein
MAPNQLVFSPSELIEKLAALVPPAAPHFDGEKLTGVLIDDRLFFG